MIPFGVRNRVAWVLVNELPESRDDVLEPSQLHSHDRRVRAVDFRRGRMLRTLPDG